MLPAIASGVAEQLCRKHHTVPRFLLRRFASANDELTRLGLPGEKKSDPIEVGKATDLNGFI